MLKKYLIKDIYFYLILVLTIVISTKINYNANLMGNMVVYYEDYANFFKNNFKLETLFENSQYTFPMWGFGIVILLFKKKIFIICFQQLITFLTILYFEKSLRNLKIVDDIFSLRLLLLVSYCYYFIHTSLTPYSISVNLFTLGILFLLYFNRFQKIKYLILSAFCFGIILNFRSDYYYLIYIIFLLLIATSFKEKKSKIIKISICVWFIIIQSFLLPWGYYTYKRVGHFLPTSTNAGHVFFLGLGQLPNNIWKITEEDNDSTMKSYLIKSFGKNNANSLSYEQNKYLLKKWKELVLKNPIEYSKKCLTNAEKIIKMPFYVGNLENIYDNSNKNFIKKKIRGLTNERDYFQLIKYIFIGEGSIFLISFFLNAFSISLYSIFILLMLLMFIKNYIFDSFVSKLILICFTYQLALSIFTFYLPIYNSNLYLIYILGIFYFKKMIMVNTLKNTLTSNRSN